MTTGIEKAVAKFDGSPTKTAAALGDGVLRQHVEHWLKVGRVPPERAPALNEKTGIPLWELCPDVWHMVWPKLVRVDGAPTAPVLERRAA